MMMHVCEALLFDLLRPESGEDEDVVPLPCPKPAAKAMPRNEAERVHLRPRPTSSIPPVPNLRRPKI